MNYAEDFYAGTPALTRHGFGKGTAYYQAARLGGSFLDDFYGALIEKLGFHQALGQRLPRGVAAQRRVSDEVEYLFLENFSRDEHTLSLPRPGFFDLLEQRALDDNVRLSAWESTVLRRER
jgi:beta-galactosidase